jgi:ubiquinone/menaquinone biosynthesis C-methylase UbiE
MEGRCRRPLASSAGLYRPLAGSDFAPVPRGAGLGYLLALEAVATVERGCEWPRDGWHENLRYALGVFSEAIAPYRASHDADTFHSVLQACFDMDSIIDFSGAWPYWESLSDFLTREPSGPLDQELFRGAHSCSSAYFDGIARLAEAHAPRVAAWLSANLPTTPAHALLDLGAGPGTYARALVEGRVTSKATCVDFDHVVQRSGSPVGEALSWIAADLFELTLPEESAFDLVYVANVLHHYALEDNAKFLRRITRNVLPNAHVIVQEYMVAERPECPQLYAAILGIHFALTTMRGRCFTRSEISSLIRHVFPRFALLATTHLGDSDLLLYGPSGR